MLKVSCKMIRPGLKIVLLVAVFGISTILTVTWTTGTHRPIFVSQFSFPKDEIRNLYETTNDNLKSTSVDCIETNICKSVSEKSDIFYYKRTNFNSLLQQPVNYSAHIKHNIPIVPRLVHFVLFSNGSREFNFHSMIAILAASRFVKPEKMFLWHDNLPVGKYWEETKRKVDNFYLVHRPRPTSVYGNPVQVVEHASDIARLEILLEFGGMYFDTDSIVVNHIDPLLYYDVTMGRSMPSTLANGIIFSKPWSDFLRIWYKEYKHFKDTSWGGMSVVKPRHLSNIHPNLIHVEPYSLCRPHWKELRFLFGEKSWDYKHRNYVVHLYIRFSNRKGNPEFIKTWNTTIGSIMRYIYYGDSSLWTKRHFKKFRAS